MRSRSHDSARFSRHANGTRSERLAPMRKLAILAAVLSGCSGDIADLGGFTLLPSIPAVPAYRSALGLGYSSDGTLWLTYVTGDTDSAQLWPARLAGDRWEIGTA